MLGLWWIIQLFGRRTPYKILKLLKSSETIRKKSLPGLRKFTYKERLRRLHLPSPELRRLHADLVLCYKINGLASLDTPTMDFFVPSMYASTRGHQYKLFKKPLVSRTRTNFLVNFRAWNFLPDFVDFTTLSRFKRSIHKVDFPRFLNYF